MAHVDEVVRMMDGDEVVMRKGLPNISSLVSLN